MRSIELLVWIFSFIILYTYAGYPIVLYILVSIMRKKVDPAGSPSELPTISFVIPAYNERSILGAKIENTQQLDYPSDKLQILVVTDGSTDGSNRLSEEFDTISWFHESERKGKTSAMNRVMPHITSEITVFSDANTMVNPEALKQIVYTFSNDGVGVVAGEKRIAEATHDTAAASGEGIYWKYESLLKSLDSRLYSVIGAAGELLAVRTQLYFTIPSTVIIEDFYLSVKLAMDGYVTSYAPGAYAIEKGSKSIKEELKRKIRIAAGGLQAAGMLLPLLNVFKYKWLTFQYVSHRLLRWTLAPLGLPLIFFGSLILGIQGNAYFMSFFFIQAIFYLMALVGGIFMQNNIRLKPLIIPYYFSMMNYAVYAGFFKLLFGKNLSIWEKSVRAV